MKMKKETCTSLESRQLKRRRGRKKKRLAWRKKTWLVPHKWVGDFVSRKDDMLRLMKTGSEHIPEGMIFFVKCEG